MTRARQPGPRYSVLMRLLRTADRVWNASSVFFGRWGLSPSQFNILNLIYDSEEGWSQTELSRELLMHRSNVTGLVDRLSDRGLVQRKEVAGDRRVHQVVLTSEGRRLMGEILPRYYGAAEEVWNGLSLEAVGRLSESLEKVAENTARLEAKFREGSAGLHGRSSGRGRGKGPKK